MIIITRSTGPFLLLLVLPQPSKCQPPGCHSRPLSPKRETHNGDPQQPEPACHLGINPLIPSEDRSSHQRESRHRHVSRQTRLRLYRTPMASVDRLSIASPEASSTPACSISTDAVTDEASDASRWLRYPGIRQPFRPMNQQQSLRLCTLEDPALLLPFHPG